MMRSIAFVLAVASVAAGLLSCEPVRINQGSASPVPQSTPTRVEVQVVPNPTGFRLPFNEHNVESKYCAGSRPVLPTIEARGLTGDEIARKVIGLWLAYFYGPHVPDWCRIAGYTIDDVFYDAHALAPPVEPQGDIMRVVRFSVKLVQVPNSWMSFPGEVDQANWLHIVFAIAVLRSDTGYTWQLATP